MKTKLTILALLTLLQSTSALSADIFKADKFYKAGQYTEAKQEYLAAAELGNPHAYYQLATMSFQGLGSQQDLVDAMVYFSLAAEDKFHNSEQIVNNILANLSAESTSAYQAMMTEYKNNHGKAIIDGKFFPELNTTALKTKVKFEGKTALEKKYYSDDVSYHSLVTPQFYNSGGYGSGGVEDSLVIQHSKEPFLILDIDVSPDGSIRNYSEVQKFGNSSVAKRLMNEFTLFPIEKPDYQGKSVDFVHRVYLGTAKDSKFTLVEDDNPLYREVILAKRKLKDSKNINDQYQYAMALMNFTWLSQEEGEAEQRLLELAKLGHPGAMYEYGLKLYREQRNMDDAIHWISKASTYGLTRAEYRLAKILQSSPWVKNDEQKALYWYQAAMEGGHQTSALRVAEIKLTALDQSLRDIEGASKILAEVARKQNNNPEYYYLLALAQKDSDNRDFTQVVENLETAISKGQRANWDVSEWQELLDRITTGNVTIFENS